MNGIRDKWTDSRVNTKFETAISRIDKINSEDIHMEYVLDKLIAKELLYSQRMSEKLLQFKPDASEELQIAARAQHICRWKIARSEFTMDKVGYLKWRKTLKKMHADITSDILQDIGYKAVFINRVTFLISKKLIKKDEETQILEDVICLVFLQYYFDNFAAKHNDEKLIDILHKTWKKMSAQGQTQALKLQLSLKSTSLIKQAIT